MIEDAAYERMLRHLDMLDHIKEGNSLEINAGLYQRLLAGGPGGVA